MKFQNAKQISKLCVTVIEQKAVVGRGCSRAGETTGRVKLPCLDCGASGKHSSLGHPRAQVLFQQSSSPAFDPWHMLFPFSQNIFQLLLQTSPFPGCILLSYSTTAWQSVLIAVTEVPPQADYLYVPSTAQHTPSFTKGWTFCIHIPGTLHSTCHMLHSQNNTDFYLLKPTPHLYYDFSFLQLFYLILSSLELLSADTATLERSALVFSTLSPASLLNSLNSGFHHYYFIKAAYYSNYQ